MGISPNSFSSASNICGGIEQCNLASENTDVKYSFSADSYQLKLRSFLVPIEHYESANFSPIHRNVAVAVTV